MLALDQSLNIKRSCDSILKVRRDEVVITTTQTTTQLHSTKPDSGSNPARGVSEIRVGEDL